MTTKKPTAPPQTEETKGAQESALFVAPKPKPHWTVGSWSGIPNYQCAYCPFATIDGEEAIRQHIIDRHLPQVMTLEDRARASGLVLGKGR